MEQNGKSKLAELLEEKKKSARNGTQSQENIRNNKLYYVEYE